MLKILFYQSQCIPSCLSSWLLTGLQVIVTGPEPVMTALLRLSMIWCLFFSVMHAVSDLRFIHSLSTKDHFIYLPSWSSQKQIPSQRLYTSCLLRMSLLGETDKRAQEFYWSWRWNIPQFWWSSRLRWSYKTYTFSLSIYSVSRSKIK